jgi:acyl carrier protein
MGSVGGMMGLDMVEVVMRVEEVFGINIPDGEAGLIDTVGDLYRLILKSLNIPYQSPSDQGGRDRSRLPASSTLSWAPGDVWVTLKAIIEDQLQLDPEDIREHASLSRDLGCD